MLRTKQNIFVSERVTTDNPFIFNPSNKEPVPQLNRSIKNHTEKVLVCPEVEKRRYKVSYNDLSV